MKSIQFFSWLLMSAGMYLLFDISWKIGLGVSLFVLGHYISCLIRIGLKEDDV